MMSTTRIAVLYGLFAALAMAVNIGALDVVVRIYDGPYGLVGSLAAGTAAGLVVKYALDKRYIFHHRVQALSAEARTFYLYSLMGLATTAVFWSLAFAFDRVFQTLQMRYVGGAIGLCVGYYLKYQLDKRYVFSN